jgi:dolichol kinase
MTIVVLSGVLGLSIAFIVGPMVTRRNEKSWMAAVLGYMVPVFAPLLLLPGHAELGLMTLQIVALGDGSATFGGKMLGGRRLPWNRKKTFSGLICFTIIGTLASTYSFWGEIRPTVSWGTAFLICGTAALGAGIVESLPIRSNDNLRVGTTALVIGMAMCAWIL